MTIANAAPPSRRATFGVLVLSGSNVFRLTVQFMLFPVLARLLNPADYGLMALAMPVFLFVLTIGEGGMGPALVRSSDPHREVEGTMFWMALAAGIGCGLFLFFGAPLIARSISHSEITSILVWLSPVLVLSAICSVPSVRIQKSGASWIFAIGDITSTIAGATVVLWAALTGWGVWSLIAQQLAIWIVKAGMLLGFVGGSHRPRVSRDAFRYLLRHGAPLVGANLLVLFTNSIDLLLTGRMLGVEQLGFYALAYQVVRIPETVLNGPVFVSFLPMIVQLAHDLEAAAALFVNALRMMLSISAPLMLGLCMTADLAVALLLGPRWQHSAPLLMILAPSAIIQTLGWLSLGLLLGRGRSSAQFKLALMNAGLTLVGVLIGASFGIVGIAIGVALAVVIGSFAYLAAALQEMHVRVRTLTDALAPTLVATAIMGCGVGAMRLLLPSDLHPLPSLALLASAGLIIYAIAMRMFARQMFDVAAGLLRRQALSFVD